MTTLNSLYSNNSWGGFLPLAPFLEQQEVWDLSQASNWNSPWNNSNINNFRLATHNVASLKCGGDTHAVKLLGCASYKLSYGDSICEIHTGDPSGGNRGLFTGNLTSPRKFKDILDGLSNTMIVGERSSRLGGSVWHGWISDAAEPGARFLGVADHSPNSKIGHFEDFSSQHGPGIHIVFGDSSTRLISDAIDLDVYQALCTRQGGEIAKSLD